MNDEIESGNYGNATILEIKDTRTYYHLAFLVDRDDFKKDVRDFKLLVLGRLFISRLSKIGDYCQEVPDEIYKILDKYRYPHDLDEAIVGLFLNNKITDLEVAKYESKAGHPKSKLRNYFNHPFDKRLEGEIRKHRYWYQLHEQTKNNLPKQKFGAVKISRISNCPDTTVTSAIDSYRKQLTGLQNKL